MAINPFTLDIPFNTTLNTNPFASQFGAVDPSQAIAFLMAILGPLALMLQQNLAAQGYNPGAPPGISNQQLQSTLGAGYTSHQVGATTVHFSKDGKGIMVHGGNKESVQGALTSLRSTLPAGDPRIGTIDNALKNLSSPSGMPAGVSEEQVRSAVGGDFTRARVNHAASNSELHLFFGKNSDRMVVSGATSPEQVTGALNAIRPTIPAGDPRLAQLDKALANPSAVMI